MKRWMVRLGALAALVAAARAWRSRTPRERRDLRLRRLANERMNPMLVRAGVAGRGPSEIAIIEHIGRVSGTVRRTPIHPNPIPDGFAISIPYGPATQWVRNIMAAGACRMQLHDTVYELCRPRIAKGSQVPGLPRLARLIGMPMGDEYLCLDVAAQRPGTLDTAAERETSVTGTAEAVG